MLSQLLSHDLWMEFLEYKTAKGLLSPGEEKFLKEYIGNKKYLPIAKLAAEGKLSFSIPEKREINKLGSAKKRVVYRFPDDENMLLKMISYLLYRYDDMISDCCYSFRKNTGAKKAFIKMKDAPGIQNMHGFKADISNYFNSIDVSILIPMLEDCISDDPGLVQLLKNLLSDDRCIWNGEVIHEAKGVMAGTPTSPFFANLYLKEMDAYFSGENVIYARYSDDILFFCEEKDVEKHINMYRQFIRKYR